ESPAIGWLVGHIICLHDIMASHRVCENPILFEDLNDDFGFGSTGNFPKKYNLEELFLKFKELNSAIVSVISTKDDDWLDEMFDTTGFPPNWQNKNRGKGFVLAVNHGIAHSGQIFEIKRMLGKGAWGF
ncbi:MAG: DinB family protein, partial [Candidatus Hermodarchaeota archaeon]